MVAKTPGFPLRNHWPRCPADLNATFRYSMRRRGRFLSRVGDGKRRGSKLVSIARALFFSLLVKIDHPPAFIFVDVN